MAFRRRMTIAVEGWYFLAVMVFVLLGAVIRQINLLLLLYGMMAGLLIISWRLIHVNLREVTARRRLPQSICAGETLAIDVELTNRRRWRGAWGITVADAIQRLGSGPSRPVTARVAVAYIPRGESRRASYRARLTQRGRYRFGPLELSTRFPIGLLRYAKLGADTASLVVWPPVGRLLPAWHAWRASAWQGAGRARQGQGFAEGNFYGLRDWRPGDGRRSIHWRTSARRQQLTVRQFEREQSQDLVLVVELWQPPRPAPADLERVEQVVSFAATALAEACRQSGRQVWLGIGSAEPVSLSGPGSPPFLSEAMTALAVAEATSTDRLPEVLGQAVSATRPAANLVVVSTRPIDWQAAGRWGPRWDNPQLRARLERSRVIDTPEELERHFAPAGLGS